MGLGPGAEGDGFRSPRLEVDPELRNFLSLHYGTPGLVTLNMYVAPVPHAVCTQPQASLFNILHPNRGHLQQTALRKPWVCPHPRGREEPGGLASSHQLAFREEAEARKAARNAKRVHGEVSWV